MSELLSTQPKKSILKKRPSVDTSSSQSSLSKSQKNNRQTYDEENVAATYGPGLENKDYGNMKIDEPNTPFERNDEVMDDADTTNNTQNNAETQNNVETQKHEDEPSKSSSLKKSFDYTPQNTNLCPEELETKLAQVSERQKMRRVSTSSAKSSDEEGVPLTVEEVEEKKKFDDKRKAHYNMKEQMLRARQMMDDEDDDED